MAMVNSSDALAAIASRTRRENTVPAKSSQPFPDLSGPHIKPSLRIALQLVVIGLIAVAAAALDSAPSPCRPALALTGEQVTQRLTAKNAERAQHLRSFESQRHYTLTYTGFPSARSAEMNVSASYRAPGIKQFTVTSESGSKLMLTRVLHRLLESEQESSSDEKNRDAVALSSENYRFFMRGCAVDAGRDLYVMDVEPRREDKFLYRGTIWIHAQDFAVVRIEAEPAKTPSFWTTRSRIVHQYQKVGEFYLPALNQTVTDVRFGGRAVLTIRYENYQLCATSDSGEPGLDSIEYWE